MKNSLLAAVLCSIAVSTHAAEFTSPDGRLQLSSDGHTYSFLRDNEVVSTGNLGLNLDNRTWEMALGKRDLQQYEHWMEPMVLDSALLGGMVDTVWSPLYGENDLIHERYNTMTLYLSRHDKSDYRINIEMRLYDEGLAFRYYLPEHPAAIFHRVVADETTFAVPANTTVWSTEWAQAIVKKSALSELPYSVEVPLTLEYANGMWASILTADVDDWCHSKLKAESGTLKVELLSPVDVVTYAWTPWHIVLVGGSPAELIERNFIVEAVSEPNRIVDAADWIRPGKIMRETTLTMDNAYRTIDFCAAHNIRYMLFDWLWYVPCTSHDGDATKVIDRLDIPALCAYAKDRGVGIWLYVNQHALMKQAPELFPLLREWGVVGVKSGFVQYATHRWSTWLHDLVRLAAENHLMMNIHDEFRPSGFSRTYPNLLTQEGICGNEEFPDANHNVNLTFTRMLCGAADYTICFKDRRLRNTQNHQRAAALTYYSPLVTLFWYDKVGQYSEADDLTWFDEMPTTWDETRWLDVQPDRYSVVARRSGERWFIAVMGGNEPQEVTVDLSTLNLPKKAKISYYSAAQEKVKIKKSKIKLQLNARDGAVMIIE